MTQFKTGIFSALVLVLTANFGAIAKEREIKQVIEVAKKQDASTDASPVMEKLDADEDGLLNREEARGMEGLGEVFDSVDEDKDGKLSLTELSKFLAPTPPKVKTGQDASAK